MWELARQSDSEEGQAGASPVDEDGCRWMRSQHARLQACLDERLDDHGRLRVLDAGCGKALHVRLGEDPWMVGIDIAAEQLEKNELLDEQILGDLQTHPLDPDSFDVVVCWDVLEHLNRPMLALDNMVHSLRSDGLLVIAGPNPFSLKGLLTKLTPFAFHRIAYRRLVSPDVRPFRTFMRLAVAPSRLERWAVTAPQSLAIDHLSFYEAPMQLRFRRRLHLTGRPWLMMRAVTCVCTLNKVDPALTDFFLVLRRQ